MSKKELSEEERLLYRRNQEGHMKEHINEKLSIARLPLKKQKEFKEKLHKRSLDKYTFLQYLPLIFSWAVKSKEIRPNDLNMLLYLHPLVIFSSAQFWKSQRELGFTDNRTLSRLKKMGGLLNILRMVL